jgi:hypothetical protein
LAVLAINVTNYSAILSEPELDHSIDLLFIFDDFKTTRT